MKSKKNNSKAKRRSRCGSGRRVYSQLSLLSLLRISKIALALSALALLTTCQTPQPQHVHNVCLIFKEYPQWYWATQDAEKRWGVPIAVQMSIMHQESGFNGTIKPSRTKLLWVIPWTRPSTAYGYTQALKTTWTHYQQSTEQYRTKRNAFDDAADFIGWYAHQVHIKAGVVKHDARRLYLAYHEGIGGYQRQTYANKPHLLTIANRVQLQTQRYQYQLQQCQAELPNKPWWRKIF